MPPKIKRLQASDFKNNQKSVTYKTPNFDIKILFNNKNKFACIVKKNIAGNSVLRNKIRRRVYSVITTVFKNERYSVVVYPKKQTLTTPHTTLVSEALHAKKEIKI